MTKKQLLKKAFTLTELLIVVIVLGVLSAVAVPKFSRVLETRKTTEAEHVLTALRAEQEHRCVLGKEYQLQTGRTETLADAKNGKNYAYSLTRTGAKATSAKGYSIQMPSYKNGVLCCEGSYCNSLNKSYPSCNSVSVPQDECASTCSDCSCPEYAADNRCACDAGYAAAHSCECANECSCEENPNQEKCKNCSNAAYAAAHRCECDASYAAANPCECTPNGCACPGYASAYPCECSPNTCACPSYAAAHPCECANECSCEENPNQEKCQNCSNATYAAAHPCECANECSCEENPNQEKCQTCSNPTYAAAHRCECDANYATANPCECSPNTCACSSYAEANPCVCAPNTCACSSYAFENRCECSSNPCDCQDYEAAHPCECYGQNSKECCKASHRIWKDGRCEYICQDGYFWVQETRSCEKDTGLSWQLTNCRSYHCCMGCAQSEIGPYECYGPCSEKGDSYTIRGAMYPGNACPDEEQCDCVCM
ncbi:type IV pilin protein [Candidatus Avelusimicrobium facis]|uniref:type IV pilin protein n=1 Tax=Candidatus Avelusimicrobium facis TaxID=3416203 RepID=UPI003D13E547